jgi:hypothetical protein
MRWLNDESRKRFEQSRESKHSIIGGVSRPGRGMLP